MSSPRLIIRAPLLSFSLQFDRRTPLILLSLLVALLLVFIVSVGSGEYQIAPLDVLRTLLGWELDQADYHLVIMEFRFPRVLSALLVGVALAIGGALIQGVTGNPLAAPEIIGINAGAGLAGVTLIVALPSVSVTLIPVAALGGGILVSALIYGFAWRGGDSPLRLVLVGIGLAAISNALITLLVTFADFYVTNKALVWLTGSVYGRNWGHVYALLPWLALFLPLALLLVPQLNVLRLSDEVARGVGSQVTRTRALLLLTGVTLSAVAVATAGPIGFVGLIAPHLARQLSGPAYQGLLPTAALLGGLLVTLADLLGRSLFPPSEVPCGVTTAIIGAPYFVYLLMRTRKQYSGGV